MIVTMILREGRSSPGGGVILIHIEAELDNGHRLAGQVGVDPQELSSTKSPGALMDKRWDQVWAVLEEKHPSLAQFRYLLPGTSNPAPSVAAGQAALEAFLVGETVDVHIDGQWSPGFYIVETESAFKPEVQTNLVVARAQEGFTREVDARDVRRPFQKPHPNPKIGPS